MAEIKIDEEELKRVIKEEMEKTQTIEDALEEREKEEALINESFDATYNDKLPETYYYVHPKTHKSK